MAPQALRVADLAVVGVSWSAARSTGCRPGRRRSPGCQRGPVPPAARTRPVPPDWSARRRPPPMPRPRGAPSGRPGVGRSPGAVPASCRLGPGSARNCQRGDCPDLGRPGRVGGVRPRTGIPTLQRRGLLRRCAPGLPLESASCSLGGLRGATLDHRGVQVEGGTAPGVGDVVSDSVRGCRITSREDAPRPGGRECPRCRGPDPANWRPSPSRSCRRRGTSGGLLFWWLRGRRAVASILLATGPGSRHVARLVVELDVSRATGYERSARWRGGGRPVAKPSGGSSGRAP